MLLHDHSLQVIINGLSKKMKRCIPKEGMPHAQKACQKGKKRCIPIEGMPHAHKACKKKV